MRYLDDARLSSPSLEEQQALRVPLSLDAAATPENAALATMLSLEACAVWYIGPTACCLAASPLWRLMCEDLLAAPDAETFRDRFLAASARLMLAGGVAAKDDEVAR